MRGKFVEATPREPKRRSFWSRIRGKWFLRDLILVGGIALLVFAALTQVFWFLATREVEERVLVEIPDGASVRRIAWILHEEGLVRDAEKFIVATRILGQTQSLQAGTYEFGPKYSELELIIGSRYRVMRAQRPTTSWHWVIRLPILTS